MARLHREVLISLSVVLLLSLSSCGGAKRIQVKSAMKETHQEMMSGNFQKALDTSHSAYQKYPKDPEILKNYINTIKHIKARGDEAFDRENFVQAQITYDLLLEHFPRFIPFINQLSFERNDLITRHKMSQILEAEKQARSSLKKGDIQKAIDIYKDLYRQHPRDIMVRDRYIRCLESIKGQADLDFKREDLALAGRTYKILLKHYSSLNRLGRSLSYNSGLLNIKIENCRKILFENGLEKYRSGDLGQAISIWRSILTFNPENPEVKKAVDRAILQSKNLERNKLDDTK